MLTLAKKFIVDENNKKVAVQIPIATYMQIEEVLKTTLSGSISLKLKIKNPFR